MENFVEIALALLALTTMEVVLGIDNIVFIAILSGKLPEKDRPKARRLGLIAALGMRIVMLLGIGWLLGLQATLFTVLGVEVSGKSMILALGGLFLLAKATHEIHGKLEGDTVEEKTAAKVHASMGMVIGQIALMDLIFSIDSVLTAVGMAEQLWVMITAVSISIGVMLIFANPISEFVERHPTVKMLALSFLLLIGMMLVAEGLGQHIPKGYIYFAMGFSLLVEMFNLRMMKVQGGKKAAAVS